MTMVDPTSPFHTWLTATVTATERNGVYEFGSGMLTFVTRPANTAAPPSRASSGVADGKAQLHAHAHRASVASTTSATTTTITTRRIIAIRSFGYLFVC
jgi:hypothetical protein